MKSAMIKDRHSLQSATFNPYFRRLFGPGLKPRGLAAFCTLLGLLFCGAWNTASAQNGFNWAQRTLASNFPITCPNGVAVDAHGNVFVSNACTPNSSSVYEIPAATGYTEVKAVGSGFITPVGLAVDANGDVFVADAGDSAVKEIIASGGYTASRTLARSAWPQYVAVDKNGDVFVTDSGSSKGQGTVYEILAANGSIPANPTITTLTGSQ
jgi:DNA-binding beta-propeller fold protein YncE